MVRIISLTLSFRARRRCDPESNTAEDSQNLHRYSRTGDPRGEESSGVRLPSEAAWALGPGDNENVAAASVFALRLLQSPQRSIPIREVAGVQHLNAGR